MEDVELLAPTIEEDRVTIILDSNHPGSNDADYVEQRCEIATAAHLADGGEPPQIDYTDQDDRVWSEVLSTLIRAQESSASRVVIEGRRSLNLPVDRAVQLQQVSARLLHLSSYQMRATIGIAPAEQFFPALGDSKFHAAQFIRHYSSPFFSPDPDMIHEVVGHGSMLACPAIADMYRLIGAKAQCVSVPDLDRLARIFWYTMEVGVIWEHDRLKAYGGALLSSSGELESFQSARICPLDADEMQRTPLVPTKYQTKLFAARSFVELREFLEECVGAIPDTR